MFLEEKIDVWEFGAIDYVIEIIYCFEIETDYCNIYFFEIILN